MKKTISIFILMIFIIVQAITLCLYTVKAEGNDYYVRVEGLTGTIAFGKGTGDNAMAVAEKVLEDNNIEYKTEEDSFTEINGLREGSIDSALWHYYVKSNNSIKSPKDKLGSYISKAGEEIVIYYTDSNVPYLNLIKFMKGDNGDLKLTFISGTEGIPGALVNIEGKNYISDDNGEVNFPDGLEPGKYTYKISGYNSGRLSAVVMDQGYFTIGELTEPEADYFNSSYESIKTLSDKINAAADSIKNYSDPFALVSLNKLQMNKNQSYIRSSYNKIKYFGVDSCSNGELESIIIAAAASGYSPYDFAGCSLPAVLYSRNINTYGTDDLIFGLIAMNYGNIQDTYTVNRKLLVEKLLERELSKEDNSGWSLTESVNPYITGAAISALSPYYSEPDVKTAVDKAVKTLSNLQDEEGFIKGNGGITSETLGFVITGLISVGVNPEGITELQDGTRVNFAKQEGDLVTAMLSFIQEDGTFRRTANGSGNTAATEQCLTALISLYQYKLSGMAYNYYESGIDSSSLKIYTDTVPEITPAEIIKDNGSIASATTVTANIERKGSSASGKDKSKNESPAKSSNRIYISVGGLILVLGIIGIASQAVNRRE